MADRRRNAVGAALVAGGAGAVAFPGATGAGINAVRRAQLVRAMNRSTGTLGGLTRTGEPVDPLTLSGHRGGRLAEGGRRPSARALAQGRYTTARVPHLRQIARPPVRGRTGAALAAGQAFLGGGAIGYGVKRYLQGNERGVRKDVGFGSTSDSQLLTGIPPWRATPVDPLQMSAASSIMAGVLVGASGKHLRRSEKRAIRRGAYRFVGAQHMVVAPTGMRGLVTA